MKLQALFSLTFPKWCKGGGRGMDFSVIRILEKLGGSKC